MTNQRPRRRHSSNASNSNHLDNCKPNYLDKYDIDNILIPSEMISNSLQIDSSILKPINVPVPKWREAPVEPLSRDDILIIQEDLSDDTFVKRHELAELNERYNSVCKYIENKQKQYKHSASFSREWFDKENNLDSLSVDEFKRLISRLESECKQRKRMSSCSLALSSHLSNSCSTDALILKSTRSNSSLDANKTDEQTDAVSNLQSIARPNKDKNEFDNLKQITRLSKSWNERNFPLSEHELEYMLELDRRLFPTAHKNKIRTSES